MAESVFLVKYNCFELHKSTLLDAGTDILLEVLSVSLIVFGVTIPWG
jgi:hypothetical protein